MYCILIIFSFVHPYRNPFYNRVYNFYWNKKERNRLFYVVFFLALANDNIYRNDCWQNDNVFSFPICFARCFYLFCLNCLFIIDHVFCLFVWCLAWCSSTCRFSRAIMISLFPIYGISTGSLCSLPSFSICSYKWKSIEKHLLYLRNHVCPF